MTATEIINRANLSGVYLCTDGERIKYEGPGPAVDAISDLLKKRKTEIIAALMKQAPASCSGSATETDAEPLEAVASEPATQRRRQEGAGPAGPTCFNCKSTDMWTTRQGDTRCRQCHPPVAGAELGPGETPDAMPDPGTPGTCSACRAYDRNLCYSFVYRTTKAGKPTPTTADRPACGQYQRRRQEIPPGKLICRTCHPPVEGVEVDVTADDKNQTPEKRPADLKRAGGNMYAWVDYTWNPIKGQCNHGCAYCYMAIMAKGILKPAGMRPPKEMKLDHGAGNIIFVGSSIDVFADDIPSEWISRTLSRCREFENKYLLQTKNPARLLEFVGELPRSSILGTTIETNRTFPEMGATPSPVDRADAMAELSARGYPTMVTIEPIMKFDLAELAALISRCNPKWVNIGANSKRREITLPEPSRADTERLVAALRDQNIKVKVKDNLVRAGLIGEVLQ